MRDGNGNVRGTAINEAVTESINLDMLNKQEMQSGFSCYKKERDLLSLINKTYDISLREWKTAIVSRTDGWPKIMRKIEGK